MTESRRKVLIFEDDPDLMELALLFLEKAEIDVYKKASSNEEAGRVVEELRELKSAGELVEFVALLDMNLNKGDKSGKDGFRWINELRVIIPNLLVFSISNGEYDDLDRFGIQQIGADMKKVVDTVVNLG